MINWKVVVGSGVAAVVLSLLTGIIGGVSFPTLLFRALLWGVIFCGLGTAISLLISKYLPELFSPPASEGKDEARPNVDIVIPDENPHAAHDGGEDAPEVDAGFYDAGREEDGGDFELPRHPQELAGNGLVEEVEETGGPEGSPNRRTAGSQRDQEVEEAEEAEELPELDAGDDGFSPSGEIDTFQAGSVSDISTLSGRSNTIDVLGHQADSEEIAKAIRTALKKDQKG